MRRNLWEQICEFEPVTLIIIVVIVASVFVAPMVFAYAVSIGIIVAILAAAAMVAYVIYWVIRNQASPITRVEAKVVRRRMKDWDVSVQPDSPEVAAARLGMMGRDPKTAAAAFNKAAAQNDTPEITFAEGAYYFVTFDVNGNEMEFLVPESTYTAASEGTVGLLVYQKEKFKYFVTGV